MRGVREIGAAGQACLYVLLLALAATFSWAAFYSASPVSPGDSAVVLAVIAGAAVAIERTLEVVWTLVGLKEPDWPRDLSAAVGPFVESVKKRAAGFGAELAKASTGLPPNGRDALSDFERAVKTLAETTPDSKAVQRSAALAENLTELARKGGDDLDQALTATKAALGDLTTFFGGFTDNPGRRLISILAGSIIGEVVAGAFGLDVFLGATGKQVAGHWGVALTGIIIGLGSSPTHEIIMALQEFKKSQREPTPAA